MKNKVFHIIRCLAMVWSLPHAVAQEAITLQQLYEWAIQHNPLTNQKALIHENYTLQHKNIHAASYPQANLIAQGTWQSDVTTLPIKIPGVTTDELANDQYKLYVDVNQLIYDGGQLNNQDKIAMISSQIEQQKISIDHQKLKEKINQLYVQLFLLETQRKQVSLVKQDFENAIKKVQVQVENGISFRSALYALESELLKYSQKEVELMSAHTIVLETLSSLTGKTFTQQNAFSYPDPIELNPAEKNVRPELTLFDMQSQMMDKQKGYIVSKNFPKLGVFAQAGYGRPALNFLSNDFEPYFIGGLRLNWMVSSFYNSEREQQQVEIQKQQTQIQRDNFLLNQQITIQNYQQDIFRYEELIRSDKEIIELRQKIKLAAAAQLEQGLITTVDYIREINAMDQAQQNLFFHELQLLLSKLQYQNTKGY
jgi:outer membrane protein TolC